MANQIERIGRFEIQSELGRGGFGRVYRAFDPVMTRFVAIKVLTEGDPSMLGRFRDEARAAGGMRHENIVTIYESGEHEGLPYMVMELLEGRDISDILAAGEQLTLIQIMDIMGQVARGLHHAHQNSIFHRDVKPGNIRLLPTGRVKLMDFGIARFTQSGHTLRTRQGDLLGTLLYMSPEQFTGQEFDARGDIFAYGVVYYQLVTGKHPFKADDPGILMCNITINEPEPVRSLNPECPEGLERIIQKAMYKDRELRYQTLEDLQFDAEPIFLDLKRHRAATLVEECERLFQEGQIEAAQTSLRQVLDLDPSNTTARRLRESLQQESHRRTLRPRIESAIKTAEEDLARRRFLQALQTLESAARLDREDSTVQALLAKARDSFERYKRVDGLIQEAKRDLQQQSLEAALQRASAAAAEDPEDPDAAALVETVRQEIERRDRKKRLQDVLSKARGLILMQSFDAALAVLGELERDNPGNPQVAEMTVRARQKKGEHERKEQLGGRLAEARRLLGEGQVAAAIEYLEGVERQFPGDKEIGDLLAQARTELRARERSETIARVGREARELAATAEFERALAVIEAALETYPGEATLIRILQDTSKARSVYEFERQVEHVVQEAETLRQAGRPGEALQLVESFQQEYGAQTALAGLAPLLQEEVRRQERAEAARRAVAEAQGLIDQDRLHSGLMVLEQAAAEYPESAELAQKLEQVRHQVAEQQRTQKLLEGILGQARALAAKGNYEAAMEVCERGLEAFPGQRTLVELLRTNLEAKRARDRQVGIANAQQAAERLRREGRYSEALARIRGALREHGDDAGLLALQKTVQAEWERAQRVEGVRKLAAEARTLLQQERAPAALALLEQAVAQYPDEAELAGLLESARDAVEELRRRQFVAERVARAEQLETRGDLTAALDLLEDAGRHCPGRTELEQAMARVREEIAQAERRRRRAELEDQMAQARDSIASGELDLAAQALARAARLFPDEPTLRGLEQELAAARARRESLERARALLQAQRFAEAEQILQGLLRRKPDDPEATALIATVVAERREEERRRAYADGRRKVQGLIQGGHYDEALVLIGSLRAEFPNDAAVEQDRQTALTGRDRARLEQRIQAIRKQWQAAAAHRGSDREQLQTVLQEASRLFSGEELEQRPDLRATLVWAAEAVKEPEPAPGKADRRAGDVTEVISGPVLKEEPEPPKIEPRPRIEPEPKIEPPPPPPPVPWKWIGTGVAVVALAVAVYFATGPKPKEPELTIPGEALTFTFETGQPAPEPRSVTIGSTGAPRKFTAEVSDTWLSVNPQSGQAPGSLRVTIDPTGLAPGTHRGSVILGPSRQPLMLAVNLVVKERQVRGGGPPPPPTIRLNPAALTFTAEQGGKDPPAQSITVARSAPIQFAASPSKPWLLITDSTSDSEVRVMVDTRRLLPGTYAGEVRVTAEGAANSPQVAHVRLVLAASPKPQVTGGTGTTGTGTTGTGTTGTVTTGTGTTTTGGGTQIHLPPDTDRPSGPYAGRRSGRFSWSGNLPPNGRLLILRGGRILEGGGAIQGNLIAIWPGQPVHLRSLSPAELSFELPSASNDFRYFLIRNTTGRAVTLIDADWAVGSAP